MIEKQKIEKTPIQTIKQYLFPIALSTAILYFLWILLDWVGHIVTTTAMLEGMRFVGIAVTVLVLVVLGLFLTCTTLECFSLKRGALKERLPILIFNAIVSVALLVLFLLVMVRVSQYSVWCGETVSLATYATNGRLMGCTFAFLIYVAVYFVTKQKTPELNENVQMIKSLIWTMLISAIATGVLMIFRIVGGFLSFQKIFSEEVWTRLASGAVRAGNIAIPVFGVNTILVLGVIPLLFLIPKNENLIKKQILISALVGGISLVLFVVTLAVLDENIVKIAELQVGTVACTILLLCNFAAVLLFALFSFFNNKKFFGLYIDLKPKKRAKKSKKAKGEDKEEPKDNAEPAVVPEEAKVEEPLTEETAEQPLEEIVVQDVSQINENVESIDKVEEPVVAEESVVESQPEEIKVEEPVVTEEPAVETQPEEIKVEEPEVETQPEEIKVEEPEVETQPEEIKVEEPVVVEESAVETQPETIIAEEQFVEAAQEQVDKIDTVEITTSNDQPSSEEVKVLEDLNNASNEEPKQDIQPEPVVVEEVKTEIDPIVEQVVSNEPEEQTNPQEIWVEEKKADEPIVQDIPSVEEKPIEVLDNVSFENGELEIKPEEPVIVEPVIQEELKEVAKAEEEKPVEQVVEQVEPQKQEPTTVEEIWTDDIKTSENQTEEINKDTSSEDKHE